MSKSAAVLVDHRKLAGMLGVCPKTVRRWVERQQWPRPHAAAGSLLFYRVADVDHFIKHGRWPDSMIRPEGG